METITFDQLPSAIVELSKRLANIEVLLLNRIEQSTSPDKLLTVQEAASFLNLSVPTVYSKVSKGELPYMKRSKRLYFSSIELHAYLKEGSNPLAEELNENANQFLKRPKR